MGAALVHRTGDQVVIPRAAAGMLQAGWVGGADVPEDGGVGASESGDIVVLFRGEALWGGADGAGSWWSVDELARAYEREGIDRLLAGLEGTFTGLVIDQRQHRAFLFNDRYGVDRLYWCERDGDTYFASEAKALLNVLPELRRFDPDGVAQVLALGHPIEGRTLFQHVGSAPAATLWTIDGAACRKSTYFTPASWESQQSLTSRAYDDAMAGALSRVIPRYYRSPARLGLALTGGLDSRIVLAARPAASAGLRAYTFGAPSGETYDSRIARRLAAAAGVEHSIVRLRPDFFSDFADHADRTVYITDGLLGVTGTHELYLSEQARQLAAVRLTGVFGGEILRGVPLPNPTAVPSTLLAPEYQHAVSEWSAHWRRRTEHPVTGAAFGRLPLAIAGSLAAARTQLVFRTPFLDSEIVKLAYRAPRSSRLADSCNGWLTAKAPGLAAVEVDRGQMQTGLRGLSARVAAEVAFKLDYLSNDGLPDWLAGHDALVDRLSTRAGLLRHRYLRYRRWFRADLASYVSDAMARVARQSSIWNASQLATVAADHIGGRRNLAGEINAILTLEAVERQLLRGAPASAAVSTS
jgi:asparagine synthase (glutamine-hydrolysing)